VPLFDLAQARTDFIDWWRATATLGGGGRTDSSISVLKTGANDPDDALRKMAQVSPDGLSTIRYSFSGLPWWSDLSHKQSLIGGQGGKLCYFIQQRSV
jgi:hypothetical protein